jgi:hypothetical protein
MSAPATAFPPGSGALPGRPTPAARAGLTPHRACEQAVAALGPDLRQVRP